MGKMVKVFVIVSLTLVLLVSGCDKKETVYQSTQSMTLDNSNIVYEYVQSYENDREVNNLRKHIWQGLLLYVNSEIGIYEVDVYNYSTGITILQTIEHNYRTGKNTVLREERIKIIERDPNDYWHKRSIVFDDDTILYAHYDELRNQFIERLDINSREQETIKTVYNYNNNIYDLKKIDDDNIVVMYIDDLEIERKYSFEIININTKESKMLYETVAYSKGTGQEDTKVIGGDSINSFCIDNGEIVLLNRHYENDTITENKIIIVDTDGNIVNEYLIEIDDSKWDEMLEIFDNDEYRKKYLKNLIGVSKVNDYVSVKTVSGRVTVVYKIIDDKLVQLEMPSSFYNGVGVDEISQMKLDKRYYLWLEQKEEEEKAQGIIVLDTMTGEVHRVGVNCEGKLEGYAIDKAYVDYDNKIFIGLSCFLEDETGEKKMEVIVDVNELGV